MYWADYLADTTHLSTFQHGCYLLLIAAYWRRGKPLPDEQEYLASLCQCTLDKWSRYGSPVKAMFSCKNGLLVHKRIDLEILRSCGRIESARNAASIRHTYRNANHSNSHIHSHNKKESDVDESPSIRVLEAIGVRNDPNWHGDGLRVTAWINDGADLDLDILPTIKRVMAKRNGQGPPRSLKYFDQAIADAKATRLAPLPNGTPKGNGNGHSTGPVTKLFEGAARAIAKREAADSTTNHNPPKSLLDRR